MRVIRDFKNELLRRREIVAIVENEANPGFERCRKEIAEEFRVSEDSVVIKGVKSKFGSHEFKIDAFIYDSEKDKEMIEPKPKAKRVKIKGGT